MTKSDDMLRNNLSRRREITISVTGRKSGRIISNPVWFVFDDNTLYLLPVYGSETQWYKNVVKQPSIKVDAGNAEAEIQLTRITDSTAVASVVEKFRGKYGASDVKKYYSKCDVAAMARVA